MASYKKFAVLGGDLRQAALASYLVSKNYEAYVWGLPQEKLPSNVMLLGDLKSAISGADVLVLPLPASPDSKYLNMPLMQQEGKPPRIFDILEQAPKNALIAGGRLSPQIKEMMREANIRFFDYFESEELKQKNAVPTAEGAIEVLMREIPRTVSGLSVAVTGFGRVSRALVKLLLAMGAKVTVVARKDADIAEAQKWGCRGIRLGSKTALFSLGNAHPVIFNTVPSCLFDEAVLLSLGGKPLIIDLASAPGGVDASAASTLGIRVIFALSLPGKYAPTTAGEIIAETILTYLKTGEEENI